MRGNFFSQPIGKLTILFILALLAMGGFIHYIISLDPQPSRANEVFVLPEAETAINIQPPKVFSTAEQHRIIFAIEPGNQVVDSILVDVQLPDEKQFQKRATLNPVRNEWVDNDLQPGTKYNYLFTAFFNGIASKGELVQVETRAEEKIEIKRVKASRSENPIDPPIAVPERIEPLITLKPPVSLSVDFQGLDYLQFSWSFPEGLPDETKVIVERTGPNDTNFREVAALRKGTLFYLDKGLVSGKTYQYRLYSEFDNRRSAASKALSFTVPPEYKEAAEALEIGKTKYDEKDFETAVSVLEQISRPEDKKDRYSYYLPAQLLLGKIKVAQKKYLQALGRLKEALAIESSWAEIHFWLAISYQKTGNCVAAIKAFEKVFKYQHTLTRETFEPIRFQSFFGQIKCNFHLWQKEGDRQQKRRYGSECFRIGDHVLTKYCQKRTLKGAPDFSGKCGDINLYLAVISDYSMQEN